MSERESGSPPTPKKSVAREYLESVVVAVILALFIRTFAVQAFKIPTGSMETNLLIGDHLLVNKLVYSPSLGALESTLLGKKEVQRGHVVVFKFPEDPSRDFIKRVIGLPGDLVECKGGTVYINGQALEEPYIKVKDERPCGPYKVPTNKLFVMGDNRLNSRDSRYGLGFIPYDKVIGRAFVIIWPPSRMGWLRGS